MIRDTGPIQEVYSYCEAVLAGDVVACKATVQVVKRFIRDLRDKESPYVFEESTVNAYCRMIPKVFRHFEGALDGHPIELQPWQMFLIGNVFGWKRRIDGKRRFKKAFVTMGRKGGKSILAGIIEIILARMDGEGGAQVYSTASKMEQSKIVHRMVELMVRASPELMKTATIHKNNIMFPENSFCRPLGSDKPFDGTNTHAVVIDELHAWQEHHRPFYDTMVSASGTRTQPLEFVISTAGTDKSYIFNEELDYARGILDGTISDDRMFVMIYELDKDHDFMAPDFDVELMLQANPNMGVSIPVEFYVDELNKARQKPSAKRVFQLKFANQCASSVESSMTAEVWDACAGQLSDWSDADGIGCGVDVGGQDDLASYALAAKFAMTVDEVLERLDATEAKRSEGLDKKKVRDGRAGWYKQHRAKRQTQLEKQIEDGRPIYRHEVRSQSFISSQTKRDLTAEPFRTWIDEGKLIVSDFVVSELKEHLLEDCQALGCEYVAYDPWNALQLAEDLENEGMTPVKMPQNAGHFNETMVDYALQVSEGRFKPDEKDVILRWCALNMSIKTDSGDRMAPDKKHSKEKIDAAVAMLMAKRASMLAETLYRGPMVF